MNSVIIPAAGNSSRMGKEVNKLFLKLDKKEIIAHTISIFQEHEKINEIILVINSSLEKDFLEIIKKYNFNKVKVVNGGNSRLKSVYNGLKIVDSKTKIVFVHDGARPFLSKDKINDLLENMSESQASILAVPCKDTIKLKENNKVKETLKREKLVSVQTPQVFTKDILKKAYKNAIDNNIKGTDDSSLVEKINIPVDIILGDYKNIKITTCEDILIGERFIRKKENKCE